MQLFLQHSGQPVASASDRARPHDTGSVLLLPVGKLRLGLERGSATHPPPPHPQLVWQSQGQHPGARPDGGEPVGNPGGTSKRQSRPGSPNLSPTGRGPQQNKDGTQVPEFMKLRRALLHPEGFADLLVPSTRSWLVVAAVGQDCPLVG